MPVAVSVDDLEDGHRDPQSARLEGPGKGALHEGLCNLEVQGIVQGHVYKTAPPGGVCCGPRPQQCTCAHSVGGRWRTLFAGCTKTGSSRLSRPLPFACKRQCEGALAASSALPLCSGFYAPCAQTSITFYPPGFGRRLKSKFAAGPTCTTEQLSSNGTGGATPAGCTSLSTGAVMPDQWCGVALGH